MLTVTKTVTFHLMSIQVFCKYSMSAYFWYKKCRTVIYICIQNTVILTANITIVQLVVIHPAVIFRLVVLSFLDLQADRVVVQGSFARWIGPHIPGLGPAPLLGWALGSTQVPELSPGDWSDAGSDLQARG